MRSVCNLRKAFFGAGLTTQMGHFQQMKQANVWLMKTEPDVFSFDNLLAAKNQTCPWDGVRNYQARNFMRDQMQVGDLVLFYHSSCEVPGIAGLAKIASPARTDAEEPWVLVDVKAIERFPNFVSLNSLREESALKNMLVLRKGQRLSIQPVDIKDFCWIVEKMSGLAKDKIESLW